MWHDQLIDINDYTLVMLVRKFNSLSSVRLYQSSSYLPAPLQAGGTTMVNIVWSLGSWTNDIDTPTVYAHGHAPGGGGGHSTSQLDRGVPLGGSWPCHNHNALGAWKIHPVTIYTLLKIFKCIPCCNIAHLGYIIYPGPVWLGVLSWQAKKRREKKGKKRSSPPPGLRACHKTLWVCDPVINEVVRHSQEGRFWYPVSMVMTTLGRFDTLCQYSWSAKSYPVQRHFPITFNNGGAPPPPPPGAMPAFANSASITELYDGVDVLYALLGPRH